MTTLLVAAVIHLLPLPGVLSASRLRSLYDVPMDEPNLQILMRHRAVLFGLLGAFLVAAAFVPAYRTAAFAAGVVSALSFIGLARVVGDHNAKVARVVVADLVALVCLVLGCAAHVFTGVSHV